MIELIQTNIYAQAMASFLFANFLQFVLNLDIGLKDLFKFGSYGKVLANMLIAWFIGFIVLVILYIIYPLKTAGLEFFALFALTSFALQLMHSVIATKKKYKGWVWLITSVLGFIAIWFGFQKII